MWAQLARRVHHEKENLTTKGKGSATQSLSSVSHNSAQLDMLCVQAVGSNLNCGVTASGMRR